jgi:hypothetical protein
MYRSRKGLIFSLLFGAVVASANGARTAAVHPQDDLLQPGKGQIQAVNYYVCPDVKECAVTVAVAKPAAAGTKCTFKLTGDDKNEFFYIDRNAARNDQVVSWTLIAADAGWTAEFATRPGKKKGIHFTEGEKDHIDAAVDTPSVQKRKIKRNKTGRDRRSLLLYDIDVTLTKTGEQPINCESFGPGILNRGG